MALYRHNHTSTSIKVTPKKQLSHLFAVIMNFLLVKRQNEILRGSFDRTLNDSINENAKIVSHPG